MLSWTTRIAETLPTTLITSNDIKPIDEISLKILDENVNLSRIKKYFTKDAWDNLKDLVSRKRDEAFYECIVCKSDLHAYDSLVCDSCLEWYHLKCVALKNQPKKAYWICRVCYGNDKY